MTMQDKKNSLVTGGIQGIGKAIASHLTRRGDNVFVFDVVDEHDSRIADLVKEGVEYTQISIDKPTLEDYFLTIVAN